MQKPFGSSNFDRQSSLAEKQSKEYATRSFVERSVSELGKVDQGKPFAMFDDGTRYRLLSILQDNPELSQRDLAKAIGMSLGKTNYCLKSLIEQGWIKIYSFRNSRNKSAYLYKLTSAGLREKIRVTRRFLSIRLREYELMAKEIEQLRHEVQSQSIPTSNEEH